MKKSKRIWRITKLMSRDKGYVTKLNHYELLELSERGYKYFALPGGKYIIEKKEQ